MEKRHLNSKIIFLKIISELIRVHLWLKFLPVLPSSVALRQVEAVANDHQLFRLKDRGFTQHLLADILANRDDPGAVHVMAPVGKVQVLAAVKGGQIGGFRAAAGPMADPARRPGMGVDDVDFFPPDDFRHGPDVEKAPEKTPVVNGNRDQPGLRGRAEAPTCPWIKAAVEVSDPVTKSPLKTCKIFTADFP
jgi:hypothetical protein